MKIKSLACWRIDVAEFTNKINIISEVQHLEACPKKVWSYLKQQRIHLPIAPYLFSKNEAKSEELHQCLWCLISKWAYCNQCSLNQFGNFHERNGIHSKEWSWWPVRKPCCSSINWTQVFQIILTRRGNGGKMVIGL